MATATKTVTKPKTIGRGKTRIITMDTPTTSSDYLGAVGSLSTAFKTQALAGQFPKILGEAPKNLVIKSIRQEDSDITKGMHGYKVMTVYFLPTKTGYDYSLSFVQMPLNCGAVFLYGVDGGAPAECIHYLTRWILHASGNKVMSTSCNANTAKKLIELGWHGLETWSARHSNKRMHYLAYNIKESERAAASKPYR